jgi:hypothetical protein
LENTRGTLCVDLTYATRIPELTATDYRFNNILRLFFHLRAAPDAFNLASASRRYEIMPMFFLILINRRTAITIS